jgi:methyl-accepting chemotaxis protein
MNLWNMIFGGQQPIGMAVNVLILILFAIACFDILRGRIRLGRERSLVREARNTLQMRKTAREVVRSHAVEEEADTEAEEGDEYEEDEEEPEPAPLADDRLRAALVDELAIPPDTLLGHRVTRAVQLRLAGLGSRDVLQQLTGEKLGSYGSLARQIGASLTLLGLLGTVFGLSLALLNIGGTSANIKGVEDLGRLSGALAGTMEGMKTAFGCTLMGLLTALILSYMNYGLRRVQSVVLSAIEEFTACDLLPTIEQVDPESDNATRAFANVLSKISANLLGLGSDLLDSAREYRSSSAEVRSSLDSLVGSVNQFSQTIETVAGNQREFTETMAETREVVKGVGAHVERSSEMLLEQLDQLRQDAAVAAKLQQSIISHHEEFKKLAESLRKSQTESVALAMATHDRASKEMVDTTLNAHLGELKKLVDGHHKSLGGILDESKGVLKTITDILVDNQMNGRGKSHGASGVQ